MAEVKAETGRRLSSDAMAHRRPLLALMKREFGAKGKWPLERFPHYWSVVVRWKHREWTGEMRRHLQPSTLCRPCNWERYLDEAVEAAAHGHLKPAPPSVAPPAWSDDTSPRSAGAQPTGGTR